MSAKSCRHMLLMLAKWPVCNSGRGIVQVLGSFSHGKPAFAIISVNQQTGEFPDSYLFHGSPVSIISGSLLHSVLYFSERLLQEGKPAEPAYGYYLLNSSRMGFFGDVHQVGLDEAGPLFHAMAVVMPVHELLPGVPEE